MFTLNTHQTKVSGGVATTTAVAPYVRFTKEGEPVIFLQNGEFTYENGKEVKPVPGWVMEQVKALNPTVKAECGLAEKSK